MSKKKPKTPPGTIVLNRKARFEYELHERFEAGLALLGWEVKALRAGKGQIAEAYVHLKQGEAWLHGSNITPLAEALRNQTDPQRARKLLLHKDQIARLIGATQKKGQTCVPIALYWKGNKVKCEIALATGKQAHDKRATIKERDWNRQKARVMSARPGDGQ